eukprot:TRINITY_DN13676_c0_g1_i1.p1 TRINITY_DN13676_c0_g1~~TRINITY_DN13676_c0_g1_i1.p1  ORF type:complete len:735 (+),score=196.15 TRINITY_DN13676_c0_g1_i1:510-2714(+)
MMMNDAVIEAQEAASRELAKLLPSPDVLYNIAAIRADYAQRQQANDAQLSSSVTTQVEQARTGIDALAKSQATILTLRESFKTIEELCEECAHLIENHNQIQLLSIVRNNLNTTLKDVEGMLSISKEAAEARQSLSDPRELIKTYEQLTTLEGKRRFALAAAASRPEEAGKLREYFEDVNRTKETFEQTLWGYIYDYLRLAKDSPSTLVRALRVVEMQEIYDEETREAKPEGGGSPPRKGLSYKDKCYEQIGRAANDRFKVLLSKLVNDDLKLALEEASAIAQDLPDVYDFAAPCFPPRYELFNYAVQLYTANFVEMLQKLGDRAQDISNIDILKLMGWLNSTEDQMIQLGVDESIATTPAESGALEPLIEEYVKRMSSTMRTWLTNLLDIDKNPDHPPKPRPEDGRLYTPVAVDVFRLLGEQIAIVQEHSTGLMLFKAAEANLQVILDFQELERIRLQDPPHEITLEGLCAMVNNNVRCHDLAVELANSIVESLEPKYSNQLDFTEAANGFLEVAKEAAQKTVEFIFDDAGVKDLVAKVYKEAWMHGEVTEYLVETFVDYFGDVKRYIEERSFKRFAEACLEKTILVWVDALLMQKAYIVTDTIDRLRKDELLLENCFKETIGAKRLKERLEALADIRELASADSPEAFTLGYTKLLSNHPDCQPSVVEKLVALREGIPAADRRDVVQECADVYNTAVAERGEPKPGFLFSKLECFKETKGAFGLGGVFNFKI